MTKKPETMPRVTVNVVNPYGWQKVPNRLAGHERIYIRKPYMVKLVGTIAYDAEQDRHRRPS